MKFILKPSLKHMALVTIAISLWNENEVRALILKLGSGILNLNEKWKTIEERVIGNVPQLSLPQFLKEKVLGFIKPIGLQIRGWMQFQCRSFLPAHLPAEFYWTPHGTIDRKKTAEVLVKDENLDMSARFKLACINCLENDIQKFWNKMSEDLRESVSHRCPIIIFWSQYMRKGEVGHISYKNEFHQSACWGNKVAVEYFLRKLTPREREESLVETAKNVTDADVLCFLLSEMEEEQQKIVLKNNPCDVLECFLQWPLQSLFIGVANCLWDFFSTSDYDSLLRNIIIKDTDGYKDWNYRELFREFWQESPNALKSSITDELDQGYLLTFLLHVRDKENIRLILQDTTLAAKVKLIYSYKMNTLCESFICHNEWDFLEFFIRECLPTKDEMLKFKDEFEERSSCFKGYFARNKYEWNKLFHFRDNSISLFNKRSVEEGECSSSKRFCSHQFSLEEDKCSSSKQFHNQQRSVKEAKCSFSKRFCSLQ